MELKQGYFVRTNKGVIRMIKTVNDVRISTCHVHKVYSKKYGIGNVPDYRTLINGFIDKVDVVKSEKNVADLLEVGDVIRIRNGNNEVVWLVEDESLLREVIIDIYTGEIELLGITTKEKLGDVEFKLE